MVRAPATPGCAGWLTATTCERPGFGRSAGEVLCCDRDTFPCVQPARGRTATTNPKGGGRRQQPERQAQDNQPVRDWPGETPGSPVARLPASGEIPPSKRSSKDPATGRATGPVCSDTEARTTLLTLH